MKYSSEDLLLEREKRVEFIGRLLDRFDMPMLFMKVNYPGLNKNNTISNNILKNIDIVMSDMLENKIQMKMFRITAEGPTLTMAVGEEPVKLKRTAIDIEDKYILGRCVDIDIYDNNTRRSISRRDLGFEMRKCFICDEPAHNCVRSQKHDQSEIIGFIQKTYALFMESFYGKKL